MGVTRMKETHLTDLRTVIDRVVDEYDSIAGIYASHETPSLLIFTVSTADVVDVDEFVNLFDGECRVSIQRDDDTVEYQVEVVASPFGPQDMDNSGQTPVYVAAGGNSEPLPLDVGVQYLQDKLENPEKYDHHRIGDNAILQIREEYES